MKQLVIGETVLGRAIDAVQFSAASYAKPRPPALLFAAIHGDEPVTQLMLERLADDLVERPPGRETWIVPCLNVDGMLAGSRNNANDVDLNRNFACASWGTNRRPGYNPGQSAEDQPETRALVELVEHVGAHRVIALHSTYRMINWDGAGETLAKEMSERCGYPVHAEMGYPTPGSFGAKYGIERGLEVITLESPYIDVDEQAWIECRSALRWCVDLPD